MSWPVTLMSVSFISGAVSTVAATWTAENTGWIGIPLVILLMPLTAGLPPSVVLMAEQPITDISTPMNAVVALLIGCNLATYFVESEHSGQ